MIIPSIPATGAGFGLISLESVKCFKYLKGRPVPLFLKGYYQAGFNIIHWHTGRGYIKTHGKSGLQSLNEFQSGEQRQYNCQRGT